ncbi:MAG: hypothetical protein CMN32_10485 [Saprospirales bacterium]|nr:hypothetical protein [Saprospirales bacterium]
MTQYLPPYPAYKDTGIPWLGRIPTHWEVVRLGAVLAERGETNTELQTTNVLSVLRNRGVIPYSEKGNIGNKKSEDISRYKVVHPDDIVVNSMNVIIGSVGLSRYHGCLSPVYYVLTRRNDRYDPRYLNAYFQNKAFQHSLVRLGNGILAHRMRIPMEKLKAEPFPLPPLAEQRLIARYLDWADGRIRRLIRARQRQIKLLEEYKQALIHQAVTGQVDVRTGKPYPAYKDSGVDWLGKVPAHWEVRPLKRVAKCYQNGSTPPTSVEYYYKKGEIPWYGPASFTDRDYVSDPIRFISKKAIEEGVSKLIHAPALLVVVIGATAGRMTLMREEGSTNQQITAFEFKCDWRKSLFILRQLRLCESWLRNTASTATIPILDTNIVTNLPCVLPPDDEIFDIVKYLDTQTARIDAAIASSRRSIDLLREYRTRLIADVVTGKVDVREVAARLPEEVEEMAPEETEEAGEEGIDVGDEEICEEN